MKKNDSIFYLNYFFYRHILFLIFQDRTLSQNPGLFGILVLFCLRIRDYLAF
jgi:hypothetical protein